MADVTVKDGGGGGQDLVHRQGHLPVDGLNRLRGGAPFFRGQQLQGVQRSGDLLAENLGKLQILSAECVELGAFHIERADHLILGNERHGQRAARARRPFNKVRIGCRIRAEIALAGGRHITGDSIALGARKEDAFSGLGRHALVQERLQPAGLGIQKTNLDDIIMQEVMRETADVELQQLDTLLDAHVGQLVGR